VSFLYKNKGNTQNNKNKTLIIETKDKTKIKEKKILGLKNSWPVTKVFFLLFAFFFFFNNCAFFK